MNSMGASDRVEVRRTIQTQAAAQVQNPRTQAAAVAQASQASGKTHPAAQASQAPVKFAKPITSTRYIDIDPQNEVEEEVKHLKRMVQELKIQQERDVAVKPTGSTHPPALDDALDHLLLNGVDKRIAAALIKKVRFELGEERAQNPDEVLDQLAHEIMSSTEVMSPLGGIQAGKGTPVVVALVGPTGVGKTTTLAKIASEALLKRGLKVGLINVDSYKVAAFDQLATYAKILNVPFRQAGSIEDLNAAISDFKSLDLILIDTTGRSQKDPDSLSAMNDLISGISGLQTQLVVSATTRDVELYDIAKRFSVFHPQGLIVSKLDEATLFGGLYNVSQKSKLPLLYFTTGQRVPEDIEEASKERLVSLIMDL
jgi:flagellar biosynthesis protein FlhF